MIYPRLKDCREDRDLSQTAVAALLHIQQAAYSKYELGQRNVPSEVLALLADFYETSVDFLMGRTDVKNPYPTTPNKK